MNELLECEHCGESYARREGSSEPHMVPILAKDHVFFNCIPDDVQVGRDRCDRIARRNRRIQKPDDSAEYRLPQALVHKEVPVIASIVQYCKLKWFDWTYACLVVLVAVLCGIAVFLDKRN